MFDGLVRPLLFAHRGASAHAPENTLPAFELAARLGAQVLELDVHLTRDGVVVVHHDSALERTTDGAGRVRDHTLAELRRLDAGHHFVSRGGGHPFRGKGVQIPTLEEVLGAFPDRGFNIEIKQRDPPMIRETLAALERVPRGQVLLAAADHHIMRALEDARPGVALGLSAAQCKEVLRASYWGEVPPRYAGRAFQVPPRHGWMPVVTGRVLHRAQAAGLEVHLWTIDDPVVAARWLRRGVDGIMSNDPGALAGVFADSTGRSSRWTPSVGSGKGASRLEER